MTRIAINGMGRIGRAAFKQIVEDGALELVAVNDLVPAEELAYLLKHDSVYGRYGRDVRVQSGRLVVNDQSCVAFNEKNLDKLPWRDLAVDIVLECTGVFTHEADLKRHAQAGAKFVILSARPRRRSLLGRSTSAWLAVYAWTVVIVAFRMPIRRPRISITGVMQFVVQLAHEMMLAPPSAVLTPWTMVGTSSPPLSAAATNLVPASTGAAKATIKALPEYRGKFDGVAIRAPVLVGSIADIVCVVGRRTSTDEVNSIFREEAGSARYRDIVGVSEEAIVSTDIVQDPRASIIDCTLTQVVDGDLVKVMSWYDNEWGYAAQLIREAKAVTRTA